MCVSSPSQNLSPAQTALQSAMQTALQSAMQRALQQRLQIASGNQSQQGLLVGNIGPTSPPFGAVPS